MKIIVTREFDQREMIGMLTLRDGIEISLGDSIHFGFIASEYASDGKTPAKVHVKEASLISRPATDKEMSSEKIADMWEIVKAVAQTPSTYYELESWSCPFCDGLESAEDDNVTHEESCIVAKARKLVRENKHGER